DSHPVITNPHLQLSIGIFEFEFDTLRPGMAKRIQQCLSSNPVNLLLDERVQRLLPSRDIDAKISSRTEAEFGTGPLYSCSQCSVVKAASSLFCFRMRASGRPRSRNIHFLM